MLLWVFEGGFVRSWPGFEASLYGVGFWCFEFRVGFYGLLVWDV